MSQPVTINWANFPHLDEEAREVLKEMDNALGGPAVLSLLKDPPQLQLQAIAAFRGYVHRIAAKGKSEGVQEAQAHASASLRAGVDKLNAVSAERDAITAAMNSVSAERDAM